MSASSITGSATKCLAVITIAGSRRTTKNGSGPDTGILDIGKRGSHFSALQRTDALAAGNLQLKVIAANRDVGGKKGVVVRCRGSIVDRIIACRKPRWKRRSAEDESVGVGEPTNSVDHPEITTLSGRRGGAKA